MYNFTAGPPYSWYNIFRFNNHGLCGSAVQINKTSCISGPTQFKPVNCTYTSIQTHFCVYLPVFILGWQASVLTPPALTQCHVALYPCFSVIAPPVVRNLTPTNFPPISFDSDTHLQWFLKLLTQTAVGNSFTAEAQCFCTDFFFAWRIP